MVVATRLALMLLMPLLGLGHLRAEVDLRPGSPAHGIHAASRLDLLLEQDWAKRGIKPAPPADDFTLLRRLYLDLIGRIPTLAEAKAYLADQRPERRQHLIAALLAHPGFEAHFFQFYADLLRLQSRANGGQGEMTSKPYLEHIKRRIRENQPYDELVRELLTAQGKVWDNPAIGYSMRDLGMPLDNLSNTVRVFLGTRIECAQCHNHPFDQWTQRQFYELAAFTYPLETNFTGVAEQQALREMARAAQARPDQAAQAKHLGRVFENLGDFVRYSKVQVLPTRQLKLPHDYAYSDGKPGDLVQSATLMGEASRGGLQEFAKWLTAPSHPRFTKVIANRLWRRLFGQGIVEPVDDWQEANPPSHPELLIQLEQLMIGLRYDLRAFLGVLANTRAYQAATQPTEPQPGQPSSFDGPFLRRMSAEQWYDSLITLIHPNPDLPTRQGVDETTAQRLMYRGKLSDALDLLTPQEIFAGALKASEGYEKVTARSKPLVAQYAAAVKAKDKALMEKLNLEIRSVEFVARTGIHDHVVVPAVARLYEKRTGRTAPPPIPVRQPSLQDLRKPGQDREYIEVPGYDLKQRVQQSELKAKQAREALFKREVQCFAIKDPGPYLEARRGHFAQWPRAADLDSPAPRGHLLRDLGQSDRDLIDNANTDASMGQALLMLNSEIIPSVLKTNTQLSLELGRLTDPNQQLQAVYLMLMTRPPTTRELQAWRDSGLTEISDLIHALLNTQQFSFVR